MAAPLHPVTKYAREVVSRKRVVGHLEYLACKRHLDDLKRQGTEDFPWVFDGKKADRFFRFCGFLRHVKGPKEVVGQPIIFEAFEKFDLGSIFGWVHKDTGYRRFIKSYDQEARKNGKSLKASCVTLYLMAGDDEENPDVYTAAVDRNQARIVFKDAKRMAEKSPDIRKRLNIRQGVISHKVRGGELMPFSRDTQNKDGFNPAGATIDEYHAHKTSEIYEVIWSAFGQRSQALLYIITTAGMDAGKSPCWNEYTECKQILEKQIINERYFVMIRELDPDDDIHDPKNWIKANPLKCLTPEGIKFLQELHDDAFNSKNPSKMRNFRIKHLNQWVYGNENSFMGGELMKKWGECDILPGGTADEKRAAFAELTRGLHCNVGHDLSKRIDLTADGFVFDLPDGRIAICGSGFLPESAVIEHEKTDNVPYRDWISEGWIFETEGDVTDYNEVEAHLHDQEEENEWQVFEEDYDPYNATQFAIGLKDQGYVTVEVRQGVQTLNEPTKLFRDLVASGDIVHDGSPALTWCVSNAISKTDSNGNIKLVKPADNSPRRIDILAAVINALSGLPRLRENGGNDIAAEILNDESYGM